MTPQTIINADCLEYMKTLPDKSFDLVLTDPPYGIDYQSNMRVMSEKFDKLENDNNSSRFEAYKEFFRLMKDNTIEYCVPQPSSRAVIQLPLGCGTEYSKSNTRLIACVFVVSQGAMLQKATPSTTEVVCMALRCTVTRQGTDTHRRTTYNLRVTCTGVSMQKVERPILRRR